MLPRPPVRTRQHPALYDLRLFQRRWTKFHEHPGDHRRFRRDEQRDRTVSRTGIDRPHGDSDLHGRWVPRRGPFRTGGLRGQSTVVMPVEKGDMFQTRAARSSDGSIRGHPARRVGGGGDPLTKNVARRMLVAAVTVACVLMLIAVTATPVAAGSCPDRYVRIKWPRGVAPDYN